MSYSPIGAASKLDFSHLGGIGIDMLLTQLHLKRSCRCPPSADHSDGALSSFEATSLINAPANTTHLVSRDFLRVVVGDQPAKSPKGLRVMLTLCGAS